MALLAVTVFVRRSKPNCSAAGLPDGCASRTNNDADPTVLLRLGDVRICIGRSVRYMRAAVPFLLTPCQWRWVGKTNGGTAFFKRVACRRVSKLWPRQLVWCRPGIRATTANWAAQRCQTKSSAAFSSEAQQRGLSSRGRIRSRDRLPWALSQSINGMCRTMKCTGTATSDYIALDGAECDQFRNNPLTDE